MSITTLEVAACIPLESGAAFFVTFAGRDDMSTKVANVIAVELGILIALLAWLAIARVPSVRSFPRTQTPARTGESFATVAPVLRSSPRNLYATNDAVDHNVLSAQAPVEEPAPDYEVATQPYSGADYPQDYLYEPSSNYLPDQPEPVLPPDYYLEPSAGFVEFIQPAQVVVFSNNRSFGRSNRSPFRSNGARAMMGRQRPGGGRMLPRGGGMPPRQHASAPPVRQRPANLGPMGSRSRLGQAGNGRAGGRSISVLQ